MAASAPKLNTLVFLRRGDEVLLAMKKRGFGVGRMNGVGGKVEPGETVEEAACREALEEAAVSIAPADLEKVAELSFSFKDGSHGDILCHVFLVRAWTGEPQESEEMAPHWYRLTDVPYKKMWIDDPLWLPQVLAGKRIRAAFVFTGQADSLVSQDVAEVKGW